MDFFESKKGKVQKTDGVQRKVSKKLNIAFGKEKKFGSKKKQHT